MSLKAAAGTAFRKRCRLVSCFWLCFVKLVVLFSLIYSSFLGFVIFCLILNIFGHFAFLKISFLLVCSYFLVLIVCISSHLVTSYIYLFI